tara:strand:- start:301 stop:828 length:528 start_codon:yes stop_codon:yes gene_type:complete
VTTFPAALADLTGLRSEECVEGLEVWGHTKRLTIYSKRLVAAADRIMVFLLTDIKKREYIYIDVAGFPTLPLSGASRFGNALYDLADALPQVVDERAFFHPAMVLSLLHKLTSPLRRIDLKAVDITSYGTPTAWERHPEVDGVMMRLIPSRVRSLAEVDLMGVRTVVTPDCVGLT